MDLEERQKVETLKAACAMGMLDYANKLSISGDADNMLTALKQCRIALDLVSGANTKYDLIFVSICRGMDLINEDLKKVVEATNSEDLTAKEKLKRILECLGKDGEQSE